MHDPYAWAIEGAVEPNEAIFPYHFGDEHSRNDLESASFVPRSLVHNPFFDWRSDRAPSRPLHEAIATTDERGHRVEDDSFVLLLNADDQPLEWTLPPELDGGWEVVLTTSEEAASEAGLPDGRWKLPRRSLVVLRRARVGG